VDLSHQRSYCLTDAHRRCPWLSVPPPGFKAADRRVPKGKIAAGGGVIGLLGGIAALLLGGLPGFGGFSLSFGSGGAQPVPVAAVAAAAPVSISQPRPANKAKQKDVVQPYGELLPSALNSDQPVSISAQLDSAFGGNVLAGNIGLSFSPKSLEGVGDGVTVQVEAQPRANVPGGPAQYSPNGSIVDISVRDKSGKLITTFPDPVQIIFKYNSDDLAMGYGDPNTLRVAYVIDDDSPELENPNHFPVNTWVFFPPNHMTLDAASGTLAVRTQAIGSIFSVVAVGIGWAQTVHDNVKLYSSFDPSQSTVFGTKKLGSYVRMVEPQIGSRLLVLNVEAGNYAYVDARDLRPSGPPSNHATN
jgi:hypothetical protein